jgi:dTDP-4-amino-4,6-dideoxygalactose transaminase
MNRHIFNQYVIRISQRDQLQAHLKKREIGTEVYYPVPMHVQECFAYLGYKAGAFPESEGAAKETLALPIYPELAEAQVRYVVDCIRDFVLEGNPHRRASKEAALQSSGN